VGSVRGRMMVIFIWLMMVIICRGFKQNWAVWRGIYINLGLKKGEIYVILLGERVNEWNFT
jgi:hypothetical protein